MPIHTPCRARRTRLKARPALAPSLSASKTPVFAPSSTPKLPGTRKEAKRTPEPTASITMVVTTPLGISST